MITQVVHCPYCQGTDIVRHGTTPEGKQRYRCRACPDHGRTFLLEYASAEHSPDVKRQIVEMALNASGIRDTARVLHVSPTTVLKELKKRHLTSCRCIRPCCRTWTQNTWRSRSVALTSWPSAVGSHQSLMKCGVT